MCFVLGFSIIFGSTLSVSAYENPIISVLAQHSESYGNFRFVANEFEHSTVQWTLQNGTNSYRVTESSTTGNYHVKIPLLFPLATRSECDSFGFDLNKYYSIAPWVNITSSSTQIRFDSVYLTDEYGHVFFTPSPESVTNQSMSPNGDSIFGKGSGVFYKGIDLITPFDNPSGSSAPSQYALGKYLYLNMEFSNYNAGSQQIGSISFTCNAWLLGLSDSAQSALQQNTTDSGTQNLINQQNQLQQQTIDKQTESNNIAQENSDTNKDTNNKITNFFNSFFDNLVHIFVPEDGFFSDWFNELNDFFAAKLGFLYAPFDFIISFFNGVLNTIGTQEHGFTIPALSWDGTEFCPEVHFSFDMFAEEFPQLQEAVYFFSDVVIILALMRGIRAKLDLVMGVHEE